MQNYRHFQALVLVYFIDFLFVFGLLSAQRLGALKLIFGQIFTMCTLVCAQSELGNKVQLYNLPKDP